MPTIVADCNQRQASFGFHPLGEVFDQARKRWGLYGKLIQTPKETEPLGCHLNKQFTGPFQSVGTSTATLLPCPPIGCCSDMFRRYVRCGRNIEYLNDLEKLPGNT